MTACGDIILYFIRCRVMGFAVAVVVRVRIYTVGQLQFDGESRDSRATGYFSGSMPPPRACRPRITCSIGRRSSAGIIKHLHRSLARQMFAICLADALIFFHPGHRDGRNLIEPRVLFKFHDIRSVVPDKYESSILSAKTLAIDVATSTHPALPLAAYPV